MIRLWKRDILKETKDEDMTDVHIRLPHGVGKVGKISIDARSTFYLRENGIDSAKFLSDVMKLSRSGVVIEDIQLSDAVLPKSPHRLITPPLGDSLTRLKLNGRWSDLDLNLLFKSICVSCHTLTSLEINLWTTQGNSGSSEARRTNPKSFALAAAARYLLPENYPNSILKRLDLNFFVGRIHHSISELGLFCMFLKRDGVSVSELVMGSKIDLAKEKGLEYKLLCSVIEKEPRVRRLEMPGSIFAFIPSFEADRVRDSNCTI